mmetsp:Transcript_6433/g.8931  ORF Transcript_6433/g.8931 Transcript_6433/m.8931 type:complete len:80 (-) Transcript_6433:368-607(-)
MQPAANTSTLFVSLRLRPELLNVDGDDEEEEEVEALWRSAQRPGTAAFRLAPLRTPSLPSGMAAIRLAPLLRFPKALVE